MKYYIKLERLMKLNKNANKDYTYFNYVLIGFYIKSFIGLILILEYENKTIILEINNIK